MMDVLALTVQVGEKTLVNQVHFSLSEGDWLMVLGPNGAGKSTLLSALACTTPFTGKVLMNGEDLQKCPAALRSTRLGVMPQMAQIGDAFTVRQIVAMGRYGRRRGFFGKPEADLNERVQAALVQVGMEDLQDRNMLTLSGGERQRAFLAQVLCQDPQVLLLDEPANHLDLVYQQQLFALTDRWRKQAGKAVISVVHDLSIARLYGNKALVMNEGNQVAFGDTDAVLTDAVLNQVWQTDVRSWRNTLYHAWDEQE